MCSTLAKKMKSLKILLIAILSAGSLTAESIITLTRYNATTQKGSEEFSSSLKMVLDDAFKLAVIKEIEKKTNESLHEGLSQYIDLHFIPYRSTIAAKGKGGHSALIEKAFAETFINYRLNARIEKSMKLVESARIELDRIREQLSNVSLDSALKNELQHDLERKSMELKQLMLSVTSDDSPLWRYTMSQPVGI
jgi:hypothetical protein